MLWNEAMQIYNNKKMANGLKKSRLKRNLQNFVDPNSFIGIYLQEDDAYCIETFPEERNMSSR